MLVNIKSRAVLLPWPVLSMRAQVKHSAWRQVGQQSKILCARSFLPAARRKGKGGLEGDGWDGQHTRDLTVSSYPYCSHESCSRYRE